MNLPEGLHLAIDGKECFIVDADHIRHVTFHAEGNGDPATWSASIVIATCDALGVKSAWIDDETSIESVVIEWQRRLGVEDGFLP